MQFLLQLQGLDGGNIGFAVAQAECARQQQQLDVAQKQLCEALYVQQHLQQDILQLKRALAAAQQRKRSTEGKLKAVQSEGSALAVALKTVSSLLVEKSEQKVQCSHSSFTPTTALELEDTHQQQQREQEREQPATPSSSGSSACTSVRQATSVVVLQDRTNNLGLSDAGRAGKAAPNKAAGGVQEGSVSC